MTAFLSPPTVEKNPNERAPLVALVRFRTDEPVSARLTIDDGRRTRSIIYDPSRDLEDGLPIVGMRADTEHRITVAAGDAGPVALTYRTPPLPADSAVWPTISTKVARTSEMQPGFTLLSVRRTANVRQTFMTPAQVRFTTRWGMLMAVDEEGEVVWYYVSDARIAGVTRMSNGNLMWTSVNPRIPLSFFFQSRSSAAGTLLPAMPNFHAGGCGVSPDGPERSGLTRRGRRRSRRAVNTRLTPVYRARVRSRAGLLSFVPAVAGHQVPLSVRAGRGGCRPFLSVGYPDRGPAAAPSIDARGVSTARRQSLIASFRATTQIAFCGTPDLAR